MKKLSAIFSIFVIAFFCFTLYCLTTDISLGYILQTIMNEKFNYQANVAELKIGRNTLSNSEKEIYDLIYGSIDKMNDKVAIKPTGFEDVEKLYNIYLNDSPEHFQVKNISYKVTSDNKVLEILFEYYYTREEKEQKQKQIDEEVNKVVQQATTLDSDYDKSKFIHDYIVNKTKYVSDNTNSIYWIDGIFIEGKGVCQAYGKAYQYLMNTLGYKALYVRGTSRNENHGWNLVELDGNFYYVDPTWADVENTKTTFIDYSYFNVTEDQIKRDHEIDIDKNCILPNTGSTQLNYYVKNNAVINNYKDKSEQNKITNLITRAISQNQNTISFQFTSSNQLNEFLKDSTVINSIINNSKAQTNNVNITKYSFVKNEFLYTVNLIIY